jgi:hypothetical protein
MKRRDAVRNADKARNSFVTRKAEVKIGALAEMLKTASGTHWVQTERGTLHRKLVFSGFQYLDSLKLIYNWENRFLSVNYNLQMVGIAAINPARFQEIGDCHFTLQCAQHGLKGTRMYSWNCGHWESDREMLDEYQARLNHPLILERLRTLDILEMEIWHRDESDFWQISCESLIGSATWMLVPPVFSMITPKREECVQFLELFELLADAVANNR